MLFLVTKTAVISLVLIILVHSLYIFLKTNLTIPKVKDLVNKPEMRYKEIYNTLLKNEEKKEEPLKMKNELKKYLQTLSKEKKTTKKTPPATFPLTSSLGGGEISGSSLGGGNSLGSLNNYQLF